MKVKTIAAVLTACLLAVAFAACGSSDDDSGSSDSGSSGSGDKEPYVIGNITTATGTFGSINGPGLDAIKAWAKQINSNGGLDGHPIELITKDDQNNPSVALTAVKELVSNPKLLALVGNVSIEVPVWAPVAKQAGVPVIGDILVTPVSYSDANVFPQGTTYPSITYGMLYAAAKEAKVKKVAVLYCAEAPVCAQSGPALKQLAPSVGVEVVNAQGISATAPNYNAPCLAAKEAGAEALVMLLGGDTVISLAQSCAKVGYKPTYITNNTAILTRMSSVPELNGALGIVNDFPWFADRTEAQKAFHTGMEAANVPESKYGVAVTNAWAGGALFEAAVKGAGSEVTRDSLKEAIWNLPKGETLDGIAPPLTFKKDAPAPQQKCFFQIKVGDGEFTELNDGEAVCQK